MAAGSKERLKMESSMIVGHLCMTAGILLLSVSLQMN